ncbi:DUF6148 family protein [Pseudomonas nitroreducens]|uniref:DUF6148 family protein n=1 Tax=Pseudomonas nitroreducens TaxID=46680 RepID=UPI0028AEF440|nr:DUF6148 family protein [Pseudomonas nitroreducens]
MAIELTRARTMLERYLEAEDAVLDGRSVTFGPRTLTMLDMDEIRAGRQEWERKVAKLEQAARGGRRPYKLAVFE